MTYSTDFRQKVLQKLAEGLSVRKVAQLFGINFMTVQKWKTNPVPKSQQIHPPKKISKNALLADVQAYPTNWQIKNQTNVIGALHEGILFAVGLFECSIDGDVFQTWVEQILLPELPKNSVVVMDNATFHKRQAIITLLEQHGHSVLWLPPYSPDLNPIETTWAYIKARRRKLRLNDVAELFRGLY